MNLKNLRASGVAVRALNGLADEITVILKTDQTLTDDERLELNEALDETIHLLARIGTITSWALHRPWRARPAAGAVG